jgi:transposase
VRFRSYAFLIWSDWKRAKPFSNHFGATSAVLLTEYTAAELRDMTHDQLADSIAERGRGHLNDPHAKARAVQRPLRSSYLIDSQADEMLTATLATQLDHIRFIERSQKRLDQHIARAIDPVPNSIISVPGLGPVITAGLLAETIDTSRFPEHRHLAQYFGISWEHRSTGNFVSHDTRLTKVGNPCGRYHFVQGADKVRQYAMESKAHYWRMYNEVSKHRHKRALVLTARKLVCLVYALLTKNEPYVGPRTPTPAQQDRPRSSVTSVVI